MLNRADKTSFVLGDDGPSGYFRIALPCKTLKQQGLNVDFAFEYQDFESSQTLVFQRQSRPEAIAEMLRWQSLGKKIIIDFDDNFLQLDSNNEANLVYTPQVIDSLKGLLEKVDGITVATQPLARVYGEYCRNVSVIPNALPRKVFGKNKGKSTKLIVGWQGSHSHYNDLKMIKSALSALARKYDFELVLAGFSPPGLFQRAVFRPWVKFSPELPHYESFSDFAIGICPLTASTFNECKSDLKWLEYSSLAIPTVASAAEPYHEIKHGETGFLARNLREWEEALAALLVDSELRKEIGGAAKEYALANRTIEGNIRQWELALDIS